LLDSSIADDVLLLLPPLPSWVDSRFRRRLEQSFKVRRFFSTYFPRKNAFK
jgi:hypothetical protein